MVEHYLNVLSVRLRGYSEHPLPQNLIEEISLQVIIGGQLDLEQLAAEITNDLGAGPRRITQTYIATAWGAAGSGAGSYSASISDVANGRREMVG